MNNFLFYILMLILCFSCNRPDEFEIFKQNLKELGHPYDTITVKSSFYYVIIPGNGCPSCIYEAERFLRVHYTEADRYLFIFTNFDSEKLLRIKLGNAAVDHESVQLDKFDLFYNSGYNGMYPVIVEILNDEIIKEYASPQNKSIWKEIL